MELTLANARQEGDVFYWDTPFPYKIQSINVVTSFDCFFALYPLQVTQYLESGRTDDCDVRFDEPFHVSFQEYSPLRTPITDIQSINIILKETSTV
jgi:hypothetical protein